MRQRDEATSVTVRRGYESDGEARERAPQRDVRVSTTVSANNEACERQGARR